MPLFWWEGGDIISFFLIVCLFSYVSLYKVKTEIQHLKYFLISSK